MTLEDIEFEFISGVSLGIEHCDDLFIYGDTNIFYITLDLLIIRFVFVFSK
jgi:hypothetical protein